MKIDNLSFDLSQEEITDMFSPYGEIGDVYVPRNHYTQQMRGFAFVRYVEKQSADAAIDAMHEKEIAGRVIRVGMAEEKKPDTRGPYHSRDRGYYRGDRGGGYNNNRRDYYREEDMVAAETGIVIEGTIADTTDEMVDIIAEVGETTMTAGVGTAAVEAI